MTLAVLLIIGAAVVGPIDAKAVSAGGIAVQCPVDIGNTHCAAGVVMVETLPELCARAMKEIGAREMPAGFAPTGTDTPRIVNVWLVDGLRVACIPVPEGYRR